MPLVLFNIGWMKHYRGQTSSDRIFNAADMSRRMKLDRRSGTSNLSTASATATCTRVVLRGDTSAFVQSSTEIPGTRLNSSVFAVTTIRPRDRACPQSSDHMARWACPFPRVAGLSLCTRRLARDWPARLGHPAPVRRDDRSARPTSRSRPQSRNAAAASGAPLGLQRNRIDLRHQRRRAPAALRRHSRREVSDDPGGPLGRHSRRLAAIRRNGRGRRLRSAGHRRRPGGSAMMANQPPEALDIVLAAADRDRRRDGDDDVSHRVLHDVVEVHDMSTGLYDDRGCRAKWSNRSPATARGSAPRRTWSPEASACRPSCTQEGGRPPRWSTATGRASWRGEAEPRNLRNCSSAGRAPRAYHWARQGDPHHIEPTRRHSENRLSTQSYQASMSWNARC